MKILNSPGETMALQLLAKEATKISVGVCQGSC